ncbi:hypothetical protein ACINK0_03940 [Deinococcus sp. VB343]|uniref:Uncharacterized protein n=1 Tax=Deinococcus sp. VB142 TaxID=3112952 RepID=A0AAU6Q0H2_9DEIO
MKTLPYISTAALLGITLSACNGNKEPTAADFTSLLKNISEQHCTDLTKLPMDLNTYYNEIPNDPNEPKYKIAMQGNLVDPGSGPILKPTARYAEIKAKIKDGKPDGLIKEMRMPPSSGILMVYDNKKPDWRRRHYVIRPVVPLAEKSTVARPTSPHHDHLDAGWSDALQIHSSSAVVLFSSLRKPDKRKARSGGSSVPSFSRRFQEQRSFKLF